MKKIFIFFICLFISITSVQAECQDTEILKWARDVELKFKTTDGIYNTDYLYYLYLEPSRDDIELKASNDIYSDITYGTTMGNGVYAIPSYIHFEEKTYIVEVFMKKDAKACAGEQILKLRKTIPPYNKYSNTAYCHSYPQAEMCQRMYDTEDITQEEFIEEMEEYIKNGEKKKDNTKKNWIKIIIFDYLIWALIPALLIGILYKIKINKVRRLKNEK